MPEGPKGDALPGKRRINCPISNRRLYDSFLGGIPMSEQCNDILRCDPGDLRQAMSIHTRKITDSCRDKDCIEDLRVYLTTGSQSILDSCANARVRSAELLYTFIDVEPVAFDRNHYCIDITFYYRILADAVVGTSRPAALYGLAVFSKRAVLCGEDSRAHIYRSNTVLGGTDGLTRLSANLPTAVVEVTDTNSQGGILTHIRAKQPAFVKRKQAVFCSVNRKCGNNPDKP